MSSEGKKRHTVFGEVRSLHARPSKLNNQISEETSKEANQRTTETKNHLIPFLCRVFQGRFCQEWAKAKDDLALEV